MTKAEIVHEYTPRGAAHRLLECRDLEVLMSGPAGTGKSRACLEKLNLLALLHPGLRGVIIRKTAASLPTTALDTWRKAVIGEAVDTGRIGYYGGSVVEPAQYRYANGSQVHMGGMDKASKIMSSEYDVAFVQEAIELTKDDWEAILSRLRNGRMTFHQIMGDTNPSTPTHWLKQRCDSGTTILLDSRHHDNPVYVDDNGEKTPAGVAYIDGVLARLTGVRGYRLRDGLWVAAEGIIYDEWDPDVHLVDARPIPPEWARYWVVDFGYNNPFVCQFWAQTPDGQLVRYREIYRTHQIVEDHAAAIMAQVKNPDTGEWTGPKPQAIICDHDAEDRATLERHLGMATIPAHKTVLDGLNAVAERLRPGDDGRPGIVFMRDSLVHRDQLLVDAELPTCSEEEIAGYVWDVGAGKKTKEAPLKENDHGMDCARYMVAHVDLQGSPRLRWL